MTREEAIEYLISINDEFKKLGFNRQLTTAIETLTSNPWHKTSEGLPKDRCFVACRDFPRIEVLEYSERKNGYWNTKGSFFAEPEASQYFTYWMEIPELPKED